jgi:hypothetical protein
MIILYEGPYSQLLIFFEKYEWAKHAGVFAPGKLLTLSLM